MPINISDNKTLLFNIISNDKYIKELGFLPGNIYKHRNTVDKLMANTKQIFIFNATPINTANPVVVGVNYQIDVVCNENYQDIADKAMEQIIALLVDQKLGELNPIKLVSPSPTELQCASGFYCVSSRFVFYSTIYNKLKRER